MGTQEGIAENNLVLRQGNKTKFLGLNKYKRPFTSFFVSFFFSY